MSELPDVCTTAWRKARKEHICCECRQTILAGERYRYTSGLWDRRPAAFKECAICAPLRDEMCSAAVYPEEAPAFGELREHLLEAEAWGWLGPVDCARLDIRRPDDG